MRRSSACGVACFVGLLLTASAAPRDSAPHVGGVVAIDARVFVRIYDGGSTNGWMWACDPKKAGSCDPANPASDLNRTANSFCVHPNGRLAADKKSYPVQAANPGTTRVTGAADAWVYTANLFVGRSAGVTVWETVNCRTSLDTLPKPAPKPKPGTGSLGVDYAMPDRFGRSRTSEGLLLYPRTKAQLAPESWHVIVTVKRRDGRTCLPTEELTITVPGQNLSFKRVAPCSLDVQFPTEGAYSATLKLKTTAGVLIGAREIVVQDWLIVGIGDSNGSGEGAPDRPAALGVGGALWQNSQCHRSANSYQALTAKAIERDPRTSVTFVHVACSGASIVNGVLGRYEGIEPGALLQPQLTTVKRLIYGREIDVVLVSVGVNDLRFGAMAGHCVKNVDCASARECSPSPMAASRVKRTPAFRTLAKQGLRAIMLCMAIAEVSSRNTQLLKGVLDVCLLAVISEQPAYGYEMTKRLAERGLSGVGEGSIYPVLGRIERDGMVETFRQASNGGPPRKYYRLTENGRQSLQRWSEEWRSTRSAVDRVLDHTTRGVIA